MEARTTAPGGGSVAANVGTLGAAFTAMVGKMSYGKKAFEQNDQIMRRLIPPLHSAINELFILIDATLMLMSIMSMRSNSAKILPKKWPRK